MVHSCLCCELASQVSLWLITCYTGMIGSIIPALQLCSLICTSTVMHVTCSFSIVHNTWCNEFSVQGFCVMTLEHSDGSASTARLAGKGAPWLYFQGANGDGMRIQLLWAGWLKDEAQKQCSLVMCKIQQITLNICHIMIDQRLSWGRHSWWHPFSSGPYIRTCLCKSLMAQSWKLLVSMDSFQQSKIWYPSCNLHAWSEL